MRRPFYIFSLLIAMLAISGCTGNYKYSDDEYRPLGEPTAVNRGV